MSTFCEKKTNQMIIHTQNLNLAVVSPMFSLFHLFLPSETLPLDPQNIKPKSELSEPRSCPDETAHFIM